MVPRQYSFQFGRITIITGQASDRTILFGNVFSVDKPVSDRFNKFLFLNVQKLNYNQETFYVGQLVKYKAIEEEVVIEDSRAFGISMVDDAVVAKPEFVLHPNSGIIAFRPIPSRFSAGQFRDKFARLVEASFDNFFINAKVEAINEDFEIREQFSKFKTILSINIELHPSNPHNRDLWEHIDNEIKELGASEFQQKVSAGPNGLNKEKILQGDLFAGIIMASDGYGHASIDGIMLDGRHVTVTTSDNPTETKTIIDGDSEHLIAHLIHTFQMVWNRIKNGAKD